MKEVFKIKYLLITIVKEIHVTLKNPVDGLVTSTGIELIVQLYVEMSCSGCYLSCSIVCKHKWTYYRIVKKLDKTE